MKKLFAVCVMAVLAMCCAFTACGTKIADNTEHFDDITKTLKLSKLYDGKTLLQEGGGGIEEAVAPLPGETTDGDTTYFALKTSGDSVTVRYQGVDTPESTAGVEKWGKAASKFTNERLHAATTIVIESASGGVPDKDSVGQRSLCYVWYKTAEDKNLKLLNLELVENGYSLNKESASNAYYSYFQKAEEFARSIKLRLFSDLEDPLFNTAVQDISLKDFNEHPENFEENSKVRLTAYLTNLTVSGTGTYTFEMAQYDEETKKEYKLNLYAGYRGSAVNMRVGDLYRVVGTLQKHDGQWQVSGVEVDNDAKDDLEVSCRMQLSYYLTFNASSTLYTKELSSNCYGNVTVTAVSREGTALTFTGTAPKIKETEPSTFTFKVTVPESYSDAIKVGTVLSVSSGFQLEQNSGVVTVTDYSKISIK